MPPIMANPKDGQDHKDKYFHPNRKILSQKITMCNMKALSFLTSYKQRRFLDQMSRSKSKEPTERSYHKEYLCEISRL